MKNFLRKGIFSDRADSILVPTMFLIPVLAISVGLAIEVAKNSYIRAERISAIQESTASAVKMVDSRGSLNWNTVERVVDQYEYLRFGESVFGPGTDDRIAGEKDTQNSKVFNELAGEKCLAGTGDSAGELYPQYKITLDTGRENDETSLEAKSLGLDLTRTVSFTRTPPSAQQLANSASTKLETSYRDRNGVQKPVIYRSITVEIIDQTPNLVMGMAGVPCQKFDLTASSVTFYADSDFD